MISAVLDVFSLLPIHVEGECFDFDFSGVATLRSLWYRVYIAG